MNTRSTLVDRAHADMRLAALLRQAPIEFARAVYGINDHAGGRTDTMAARAYLPTAGQEHCPRCWVVYGHKSPLRFREATEERPETATCSACSAEYATTLG
jgi:hypothetical protein